MGFGDCKALISMVSNYLHSALYPDIAKQSAQDLFSFGFFLNFIKLRKYKMVFLLYILISSSF